jgi:hypothetical protein
MWITHAALYSGRGNQGNIPTCSPNVEISRRHDEFHYDDGLSS